MWTSVLLYNTLLGIFLTFPSIVRNERYLIVSSQDHCDSPEDPACLTLPSFAINISNYLQFNTELVLFPGNHTLHSMLKIRHINQLWFYSNTSLEDRPLGTNIVCVNPTARFEFTNIVHVLVSGVKFIGCGGNLVESVADFTLNNTIFDGQKTLVGTALELINSTLKAERSSFIFNKHQMLFAIEKLNGTVLFHANIGGAVIVNQSTASFLNCNFDGNRAEYGGAIYGDLTSNISIASSTFNHNSASRYGGAIFTGSLTIESNDSRCGMLSVVASNFVYNRANKSGAGVAVFHVNVCIHESKFINNRASVSGGALFSNKSNIANISKTNFSGNDVTTDCGGAVHVFNSTLMILDVIFSHNSAINGHGGALCLQEATNDLSDCTFNFNAAATFGGAIYIRNSQHAHLMRCYFDTNIVKLPTGGGRSMRIYREPNLTITNSSFIDRGNCSLNNESKVLHNHTSNCQESNEGYGVSGVGLIMTSSTIVFRSTVFQGCCESVYAYKCYINFTGNNSFLEINNEQSKAPSALYIIESTLSMDGECVFMNNVAISGGAIHAVESRIDMYGKLNVANNTALDNGGGLYLYRSDFNCRIRSTICLVNNVAGTEGGGLHAISSAIKVTYVRDSYSQRASLYFIGNEARDGGGVYLEANAKLLVLKEGSNRDNLTHSSGVFFQNNLAKDCGGAVYVADETNAATCEGASDSLHSDATECFIQVITVMLTEEVRNNADLVGVEFENNSASSGALLFGGLLDRCTISPIAEINKVPVNERGHFEDYGPGIMYLISITNIDSDDLKSHVGIRSKSVQICFCTGNDPDCSYQPPTKNVAYGEEFSVSLVAVDQVNHTVANVSIYSSMESSMNWLSRGQIVQNTSESCTELTFSILSSGNISIPYYDKLHLSADGPCKSAEHSKRTVSIHLQPCVCSVGFELSPERDKCKCVCDMRLKAYSTTCNVTKGVLTREKNVWISVITNSTRHYCTSSVYLGHPNCPFDYCVPGDSNVEINLSRKYGADVQCANNRAGILCSQCKPGYSLSGGSSNCINCSKSWVAQMIGVVLAVLITGIVLVTLLLVLNLTVAVGTINGLVFYANIVGSTSEPLMFALPQFVVAWLNLESGFDGCFINGLDAYWKMWLKFAFPMYVFILVAAVIMVSRFSPKFSRFIGKRNPVSTLNTLVLLSYSKLLHTVISIFSFTSLDCPGGSSRSVKLWAIDATIEYLSPQHFALFIVAILVLSTGTMYTFLLFSWQWLLYYQDKWLFRWVRNQKLCQFLEPYHAPYTFKHRYWTGLLLLVRVVLFVVLATNTSQDPYASLVAISIAVSSLFLLKGIFPRVYKNHLPNILETFCLMNIIFLCIANFYTINKGFAKMQKSLAYISGSITTLLFLFVIAYHLFAEIIIKHKFWVDMKNFILKNKTMIWDAATVHRQVVALKSASSYTTSVVEAPQDKMRLKHASNAEIDLRELLLESVGEPTYL